MLECGGIKNRKNKINKFRQIMLECNSHQLTIHLLFLNRIIYEAIFSTLKKN